MEKKEIKVLGPGCSKCKKTFAVVEKVVESNGVDADLIKVDDIEEIMRYNIMSTPAIVIDGKVVLKGKVPSEAEVKAILKSLTPDPSPRERMEKSLTPDPSPRERGDD